jgi:hypothetical protein
MYQINPKLFKFSENRKNSKGLGVTFGMWRPVVWNKVTNIMEEYAAPTSPKFYQTLHHIPHYSAVYSYRNKNLKALVQKLSRYWRRNHILPAVTLPLTFLL